MSDPKPGAVRLMMPEGQLHPTIAVADQEGRWIPVRGVSRIEFVCDGGEMAGRPKMRVEFCPLILGAVDVLSEADRVTLGLAGVDDALIEAARSWGRRQVSEVGAKPRG